MRVTDIQYMKILLFVLATIIILLMLLIVATNKIQKDRYNIINAELKKCNDRVLHGAAFVKFNPTNMVTVMDSTGKIICTFYDTYNSIKK